MPVTAKAGLSRTGSPFLLTPVKPEMMMPVSLDLLLAGTIPLLGPLTSSFDFSLSLVSCVKCSTFSSPL